MKFIMIDGGDMTQGFGVRGGLGVAYQNAFWGIVTYFLFGLFCILAIIGLVAVLRHFFGRRRNKENPTDKWLRTGKM